MALKKQIILANDPFNESIKAEYWVITQFTASKEVGVTELKLSLYKDKEASKEDLKKELYSIMFIIPNIDASREDMYNQIKTDLRFIDAEDC